MISQQLFAWNTLALWDRAQAFGWYLWWFVLVIGALIFVHELGHFLVAKRAGVGVLKFSLGFGPKLIGIKRKETEYLISAIPLGGYVKMIGEDPKEEILRSPQDVERSFSHKPVGARSLIILAGPGANFLLAALIFWAVFAFVGQPTSPTIIGQVLKGHPADEAGLKAGDQIVAFEGKPVEGWEELASLIHRSPGKKVRLTVEREGRRFDITLTPRLEKQGDQEIGKIGIAPPTELTYRRVDPVTALYFGLKRTVELTWAVLVLLWKLIQGEIPASTLGGPLFIAQVAGEQAKLGILNLLFLTAFLSINLGVLNLLPIPILDGGHLFFALIEAIRGRPLTLRTREIAQQIGLVLLVALMIFAFYNDIFRLFGR